MIIYTSLTHSAKLLKIHPFTARFGNIEISSKPKSGTEPAVCSLSPARYPGIPGSAISESRNPLIRPRQAAGREPGKKGETERLKETQMSKMQNDYSKREKQQENHVSFLFFSVVYFERIGF